MRLASGRAAIAAVMITIGCSADRTLHGYELGAAYNDLASGLICYGIWSDIGGWDGLLEYPTDSTAAELTYCEPVPKSDSIFLPHEDNNFLLVFDDDRLVEIVGTARFDAGTRPSDAVVVPPPNTWTEVLQHLTAAYGGPPDSISRSTCYRLSTDESDCLADFRLSWSPSNRRDADGPIYGTAPIYREAAVWLRASPLTSTVVNLTLRTYEKAVRCAPQACSMRRSARLLNRLLDSSKRKRDSASAASDSGPP